MTTFLTTQDISDLINVDRSTVYRMAEDGRLPALKVGRQWRFPADRVAEQLGMSAPPPAGPPTVPAAEHGPDGIGGLLLPDVAQSITDLAGDLLGVMAVITDIEGRPLTTVSNQCGYYAAIADQTGAVEACLADWRLFADESRVAPRFVQTHLGFLCARTFVWVDLQPVGMLVVGGVTPPSWPPPAEVLHRIADNVGLSYAALDAVVADTWDIPVGEQRRILQVLRQTGDLISQLASDRSQLLQRAQGGNRS